MRIFLEIEVRRFSCGKCDAVKRERLDFLADNPRYTQRFAFYVGKEAVQLGSDHAVDQRVIGAPRTVGARRGNGSDRRHATRCTGHGTQVDDVGGMNAVDPGNAYGRASRRATDDRLDIAFVFAGNWTGKPSSAINP